MPTLLEAIDGLKVQDLVSLGAVSIPDIDTRVPGQPFYDLDSKSIAPFTIYWGFRYDESGKVVPLQQDVNTGQRYGLVSRDQQGRSIVLNGLRILFYSEKLHVSCKIIETSAAGYGCVRTGDVYEALDFLTKIRPEWEGFIKQSVLIDLVVLRSRDNDEMWAQNIRRRLLEATNVAGASEEIIDLDIQAEPEDEELFSAVSAFDTPDNPHTNLPDWPQGAFMSASDELLNPPTREDRPMLVQLKFTIEQTYKHVGGTILSSVQMNDVKSHAHYWARVTGHRGADVHSVRHCAEGVEIILGLKIAVNGGLDPKNRFRWLENAFNALKVQIENGTVQTKDGKIKVNRVDGVNVTAVRCAYP